MERFSLNVFSLVELEEVAEGTEDSERKTFLLLFSFKLADLLV